MYEMNELQAACERIGCHWEKNVPLRDYTTFRVGGPVTVMLFPNCAEQIAAAVREFRGKIRLIFVGKGSNLLASDEEIEAVAIHLGKNFSNIKVEKNILICEAGATMAQACQAALQNGLSGLEFAWGIPGSVGGGAYMNAGAYGGEFSDVVLWCEHVDEAGNIGRYEGKELDYRYRHSIYSGSRCCITRVAFELKPGDPAEIQSRMEELLNRRREKQPLEYPSAGSTFKRPEGAYAAALIEQCGLKGTRVGGAKVSEKHSGFIINYENATCQDILQLIEKVQQVVRDKTGFELEREVELLR
ncbi:MAG: UDP-N-acetylmuramate dehydrogenase [Candidatus Merdivicinus sp.]